MASPLTLVKMLDAYAGVGLTAPKVATDAAEKWSAVSLWLQREEQRPDLSNLSAEQHFALITTEAVRVVTRQEASRIGGTHLDAIAAPGIRACKADADRVVAKLRGRFDTAAAVVVEALTYYTADDYAEPDRLVTKGLNAAKLTYAVAEASADLELVRALLEPLAGTGDPLHDAALFVDVTEGAVPEALGNAAAVSRGNRRWPALFAVPGVVPALHDDEGARAVVAKSKAARAARDQTTEAQQDAATEKAMQRERKYIEAR